MERSLINPSSEMVAPTITFPILFSITLSYLLILKEDDSRRKAFCFYQFQGRLAHILKETLSAQWNFDSQVAINFRDRCVSATRFCFQGTSLVFFHGRQKMVRLQLCLDFQLQSLFVNAHGFGYG